MDKRIQVEVLSGFSEGKISNVSETDNGIMLTIAMFEYFTYPYTVLKCDLINCREFILELENGVCIKDLQEFQKYEIEMQDAEFKNSKLVLSCRIEEKWSNILIETENIKVYDELNNEISPFDLYILNGANNGIDFYIREKTKKRTSSSYIGESVKFDEDVLGDLQKRERYWARYEQKGPPKPVDLLIGLDEYGVKMFYEQEIKQLISICDGLLSTYITDTLYDQKIRYFAKELKKLCETAILNNKWVEAIGD
ncbi:hypothetical protein [Paenisporosarcina indica]|uniref:hypothetical protein n=1 Tax=Paenisporosarcina indica TaxID=650093 RepID=UPI000A051811|nr:hypothetical protein [Paenisporosarcina indica]